MDENKVVRWGEFKYYDTLIKQYIGIKTENLVQTESYLSFPSTGDSNILYLDTTTNRAYRWDEKDSKYYSITQDLNVDTISGGSASK